MLSEWLTCRLILASQVTLKTTFSAEWPPHPRAEGGQVEPVLGRFAAIEPVFIFPWRASNNNYGWS
jgi:hypothetical protein